MSLARKQCAPSTWDLPFFFGAGHHELADQARRVAMRTIAPDEEKSQQAIEQMASPERVEAERARCRAIAKRLASARLFEACVPANSGGLDFGRPDAVDVRAVCLVREMLSWASGLADTVFAMQGLGSYPIVLAGSEAQKREFLPGVLDGTSLAAFALTEPDAGSDVAAMITRARKDGGHYVLDGKKTFISNAGVAGHYVVFANANPDAGRKGITAFVVRPEDRGFVFEGALPMMAEHPIGTIRFDGLKIPASRRLGAEGDGFRIAMATLDVFRSTVGAAACGMARRALDEALARALSRKQFGQPIGDFQTTQVYLAEMATELDAARLLVYRAAHAKDSGCERVTLEASMAKMFATEAAQRVIDRALQLHGGSGVVRGSAVERLYREIRALRIYEGTTEIQRVVIAGILLGAEGLRAREAAEDSAMTQTSPSPDPLLRSARETTASRAEPDTTLRIRSLRPPPDDKR